MKLLMSKYLTNSDLPPVWLCDLPSIMNAKHDGEGAGGQQLLVVLGVEAVGRGQGEPVADQHGAAGAVEVFCLYVFVSEKKSDPRVIIWFCLVSVEDSHIVAWLPTMAFRDTVKGRGWKYC